MEKDEFIRFLENKGIDAKKTNTEVRLVSESVAVKSMSKLIRTKTDL